MSKTRKSIPILAAWIIVTVAGCAGPLSSPTLGVPTAQTAAPPTSTITAAPPTAAPFATWTPRPDQLSPPDPSENWLWQQQGDLTLYSLHKNLCLLPGSGEPVHLAGAKQLSYATISPDGRLVVYLTDTQYDWSEFAALAVAPFEIHAVDAGGRNDRLLLTGDQLNLAPPAEGENPAAIAITQLAWIPDTHRLVFSTHHAVQGYTYALHSLDADTGIHRVRLDTAAGGMFTISPNGRQIAVVKPDSIGLMDTSGENWQPDVFNYPGMITYSDSPAFAAPVWATDSSGLRVAVPPHDPQGEDTTVRTWFIPSDGKPPYRMAVIPDLRISYFGAPVFSPDGQYLVATTMPFPQSGFTLHVMRADGSADKHVYSDFVVFQGWEADSTHFLFRTAEEPFQWFRGSIDGAYEPYTRPTAPDQGCAPG